MTALLVPTPGAAQTLPPGEALRSAARRWADTARSVLASVVPWVARGIVVLALVAFAGLAVGPHVFGYRTLTMLTASMSPAIDPGDVAIVTPLEVSEVTEGMVITYHIPVEDHRIVTHRVVAVEHGADGAVTVQTKGDANEAVDPWKATLEGDTAYQVRSVIPRIGTVIQALRTPVVAQALTYGATALVAGWLLLAIWRPTKTETTEADETAPAGVEPARAESAPVAAAADATPAAAAPARPKAHTTRKPQAKKPRKADRTKTGPTNSRRESRHNKRQRAAVKEDQA